ncbi:histidine phosphatase family protein [Sansalvadorimonas verongulae]|uniref:histidine phosphatase family protein n=1 Tax=Sansalvadorimonas verongulae TaxID=2172824 RepID=UPI001E303CDB|nr:histidine phosphatase family protein [Sansalvadorimonas verongulae]
MFQLPQRQAVFFLLLPLYSFALANDLPPEPVQTLIFIRHGEKPANDLGQLDCRGFNRSLKLPAYFRANFPSPTEIYAPHPSPRRSRQDGVTRYYHYMRPLATIEPTAISFGLPVNVEIPYNRPRQLITALLNDKYRNSVIYISWGHNYLTEIGRLLLKRFNYDGTFSKWGGDDYERVLIFEITTNKKGERRLEFREARQSLGKMSEQCMLPISV